MFKKQEETEINKKKRGKTSTNGKIWKEPQRKGKKMGKKGRNGKI